MSKEIEEIKQMKQCGCMHGKTCVCMHIFINNNRDARGCYRAASCAIRAFASFVL